MTLAYVGEHDAIAAARRVDRSTYFTGRAVSKDLAFADTPSGPVVLSGCTWLKFPIFPPSIQEVQLHAAAYG
jgi:hypothetical protein